MIFRRVTTTVTVAALLLFCGCSAQPVSRRTELEMAAAGAVIGAGSGALIGTQNSKYSMLQTSVIGAASLAGVIILYEEVKREAGGYGPYQDVVGSENQEPGIGSGSSSSSSGSGAAHGNATAGGLKLN